MSLLGLVTLLILARHNGFAQDGNPVVARYSTRMGYRLWSNYSVSCTRFCDSQFTSNLWHIQLPGENTIVEITNPSLKGDFEDTNGVALYFTSNETSCASEVIEYTLTIMGINSRFDGAVVRCGVRQTDTDNDDFFAFTNTTLYLESEITTYTTFQRVVTPGSSTTITCSRPQYPDRHISNRWRLQLGQDIFLLPCPNKMPFLDKLTNTTLEMSPELDVCTYDEFVNYTLTIGNINSNVSGLIVTCGARDEDSIADEYDDFHDEWYAEHSVELVVRFSISTSSQLIVTVKNNSDYTLSCTRTCGQDVFDLWTLQIEDKEPVNISSIDDVAKLKEFELKNRVTLLLNNSETDVNCANNGLTVHYLTAHNITKDMTARCESGTQGNWYSSHSVRLKIDNTTEMITQVVEAAKEMKEIECMGRVDSAIETARKECMDVTDTELPTKVEDCPASFKAIIGAVFATGFVIGIIVASLIALLCKVCKKKKNNAIDVSIVNTEQNSASSACSLKTIQLS